MSTTPFDTDDNDRLHCDFTVGRAEAHGLQPVGKRANQKFDCFVKCYLVFKCLRENRLVLGLKALSMT